MQTGSTNTSPSPAAPCLLIACICCVPLKRQAAADVHGKIRIDLLLIPMPPYVSTVEATPVGRPPRRRKTYPFGFEISFLELMAVVRYRISHATTNEEKR